MEPMTKAISKKNSHNINKAKNQNAKNRSAEIKHIIHHLMHPDYILFDWEFFSNQLEFE
jgi:hypothetical protein